MTSSEQFEARYNKTPSVGIVFNDALNMYRLKGGAYDGLYLEYCEKKIHQLNVYWGIWQASRECMEVELPEAYQDDYKGWVIPESQVKEALLLQGVRVKE